MAIPRYYAKRTDPNLGVVMERQPDGTSVPVTGEQPYSECLARIRERKDEVLHIFKVARIAHRKNAVRRLHCKILAKDLSDAVRQFSVMCRENDRAVLQLLTGDWLLICEKQAEGTIKFFNHIN